MDNERIKEANILRKVANSKIRERELEDTVRAAKERELLLENLEKEFETIPETLTNTALRGFKVARLFWFEAPKKWFKEQPILDFSIAEHCFMRDVKSLLEAQGYKITFKNSGRISKYRPEYDWALLVDWSNS